jgi:hypothetical protein
MILILVIFLAFTFVLQGCMTTGDYNQRTWVRVEHKRTYEPIGTKSFSVEDANLSIIYVPDIVDAGVSLSFINKTEKPIKIIWDESAYISPANTSNRVFHAGIKITDRMQSNPPSLIPPKGNIEDIITPVEGVDWSSTLNKWEYYPLCGERSVYLHTLDDSKCVNQIFGFYITYEVDGKKAHLNLKYKYIGKELIKPKK